MSHREYHVFGEVRSGKSHLEPLLGRTQSAIREVEIGKSIIHKLPPLDGDVDHLRRLGHVLPDNQMVLRGARFMVERTGSLFELSPAAHRRLTFLQKVVCEEHRRIYGTNDKICQAFRRKQVSLERMGSGISNATKDTGRNLSLTSGLKIHGLTDSMAYYQQFLAEKKRRKAMLEKIDFTRRTNKANFNRRLHRSSELVAVHIDPVPPLKEPEKKKPKPVKTPPKMKEVLEPEPETIRRSSSLDNSYAASKTWL